jgi:hypothetical protein
MNKARNAVMVATFLIGLGVVSAQAVPGNGNGGGPTNCGNCQGNSGVGLGNIGSSGGAPSPEVDAALGMLLAGGVVAFLRRRRARKSELAA